MVIRFTTATGVPNFTALLITFTDRSVSARRRGRQRVVDLQPGIRGGQCLEGLAAAIDGDGIFDGGVFHIEIENLHLVLVDHGLICGLQTGHVGARLRQLEPVVAAEGDDEYRHPLP